MKKFCLIFLLVVGAFVAGMDTRLGWEAPTIARLKAENKWPIKVAGDAAEPPKSRQVMVLTTNAMPCGPWFTNTLTNGMFTEQLEFCLGSSNMVVTNWVTVDGTNYRHLPPAGPVMINCTIGEQN